MDTAQLKTDPFISMLDSVASNPSIVLDDGPLHTLWSKAVGQSGYDKAEWKALEAKLHKALADNIKMRNGITNMAADFDSDANDSECDYHWARNAATIAKDLKTMLPK